MPRHSTLASYTLYFVKQHAVSGQPELHFSRLTGSELSMSMTDTLDTAWKRVVPGCVITLSAAADKLSGASLSETCTFEDPLHGKTMLERSLAITDQQIEFSNRLLQPGETVDSSPPVMKFHKHQTFEGSVNVATANLSHGKGQADWQELTTFNIFDDGRTIQLYDADMN